VGFCYCVSETIAMAEKLVAMIGWISLVDDLGTAHDLGTGIL
jgi:hypothetical protein